MELIPRVLVGFPFFRATGCLSDVLGCFKSMYVFGTTYHWLPPRI